jgi:hypothetical protein
MLPGAVRVSEFRPAAFRRSAVFVPYCTIGYRSARFARELRRTRSEVFNLDGGILAWCHAGLPLQDGVGPTRKVHIYSAAWNLLSSDYEAVW